MPYLFCYGSNDPQQLGERLNRRSIEGVGAWVEGYGRVFRGYSQRWGGGVASIEKDPRRNVYGWVAKVSASELTTLDRFEGVASGNYKRVNIKVETLDGDTLSAIAYVSTSRDFNRPSQAYLNAVLKTISTFWSDDGKPIKIGDIPIV